MWDRSPSYQSEHSYFPGVSTILIGLAAATVAGTVAYSIWKGVPGRLFAQFYALVLYLPPPYLTLYVLSPKETTDRSALADRVCATLTATGLLALWGWFVTVPLAPQNAQAPIGLFMIGWLGGAGFYGAFKLATYGVRRVRDQ